MTGFLKALLLVLCLRPEWVKSQQKTSGQQVKQSSPSLTVQEGGISILNCDYENDMFDYFAWYKKYPDNSPTLLISVRSNVEKREDGRFTVFLNKSGKHFSLHITASQPEDTAVYLCAAGARCSVHACSLYPNSAGPQAELHASNKGICDPISIARSSITGCDLKLVRKIVLKKGCTRQHAKPCR